MCKEAGVYNFYLKKPVMGSVSAVDDLAGKSREELAQMICKLRIAPEERTCQKADRSTVRHHNLSHSGATTTLKKLHRLSKREACSYHRDVDREDVTALVGAATALDGTYRALSVATAVRARPVPFGSKMMTSEKLQITSARGRRKSA